MIGLTRNWRSQSAAYLRRWASSRKASTLVIAEHDNTTLNPSSLSAVVAAGMLNGDVDVLVLGHNAHEVAQQVRTPFHKKMFQQLGG